MSQNVYLFVYNSRPSFRAKTIYLFMKIQEYFDRQKQLKLTDIEKLNLYHDFLSKTQKNKSLINRYLIFSKSFAYSFLIFVLLTSIFGVYFQKNSTVDFGNFGFMISHNDWINTVQANYIAKVVEFQWDYYIENEWNTYRSSNIASNDTIVLKKWAKLVFNINLWTQAVVVGPAKISLMQDPNNENTYLLTLKEGDYMEIKTLDESLVQENIEIILPDNSKIKNNYKKIDFQLSKIDNDYAIKNNWDQLVVTQEDSNKSQNLENKQIISFRDNDLVLIQDAQEFEQALQKMQISQIFNTAETLTNSWDIVSTWVIALVDEVDKTLNQLDLEVTNENTSWVETIAFVSDQIENDPIQEDVVQKSFTIDTANLPSEVDGKVAQELAIDQKKIPSDVQTEIISNVLNKAFIKKNMEKLTEAYLIWDDEWFNKQSDVLISRFQKIGEWFDIEFSKVSWERSFKIINISNNAESFVEELQNKFFLPIKYSYNIKTTQNRIHQITNNYIYGEISQEDVASIITSLSSENIFQ